MVVGAVVVAPPAQAADRDDNSRELRKAVTAKGVMNHLGRLQDMADRNGGTRASGTPGYGASVQYVERVLKRAGYKVTRQPFEFLTFMSTAEGLAFDVMLESKAKDLALIRLRSDMLRYAGDVASRFGLTPMEAQALATEEAALLEPDA